MEAARPFFDSNQKHITYTHFNFLFCTFSWKTDEKALLVGGQGNIIGKIRGGGRHTDNLKLEAIWQNGMKISSQKNNCPHFVRVYKRRKKRKAKLFFFRFDGLLFDPLHVTSFLSSPTILTNAYLK